MRMNEELLDEENERILNKLDSTIGLSKTKNVIRDIIRYHKVMQECKCKIEDENYNIVIRNKSYYNLYEELISVIAQIYYYNNIIENPNVLYFTRENIRNNKTKKETKIEEGLIVINLNECNRDLSELRKEIEDMRKRMKNQAFIIIEDDDTEGKVNALFTECFSWSLKIDLISSEEKEKYIKKFMDSNKLKYNNEIIKELADNPYYKIKNNIINILVNCKMKNETDILKVVEKEKKNKNKKENSKTGMQELDELIGLENVKLQIKKVISYIKTSKKRENMPMLHMCFNGNPGTGKTTVARIVGKIFAEEQILSDKKVFVEAQRCDLIGKYVGQTAPMTQKMIEKSLGGILFIDEAYSIASYIRDEAGFDYGAECIATLLKRMEDNRDNLCVIFAGYTNEMQQMIKVNPGLESRIQFTIDFPDYSSEELYIIFKELCKKEKYKLSQRIKPILIQHFEEAKKKENFSNARYVRNLYEKVKFEQAYRVSQDEKENIDLIKKCDIENVIKEIKPVEVQKYPIGFAC